MNENLPFMTFPSMPKLAANRKQKIEKVIEDWVKALKTAVNELTVCGKIDTHYYSRTYGKCYWCDRATSVGVDIFPAIARPKPQPTPAASISVSQTTAFAATDTLKLVQQQGKEITVVGKVVNTNNFIDIFVVTVLAIALILIVGISLIFIPKSSNVANNNLSELPIEVRRLASIKIEEYIFGIGISYKIDEQTKVPIIINILNNSPAFRAGIRGGDKILSVNGIFIDNINAPNVSSLIDGEVGTQVNLLIARSDSSELTLTLIREQIINPEIADQYVIRCYGRVQLEDEKGAFEDCKKAVKWNQNNDKAYLFLGIVLFKEGNKSESIENFRKAASLGNERAKDILKNL